MNRDGVLEIDSLVSEVRNPFIIDTYDLLAGTSQKEVELKQFEQYVGEAFKQKKIHGPIHLAGGNEKKLIDIFQEINRTDWVLSTWRSHYHALLHGVPSHRVMDDILNSKSMMLHYPEYRFLSSAIVGGIAPIAVGLAAAGERVWCFVGDMAAETGVFKESVRYASGNDLPVTFIVEDNGFSTNTPTVEAWGTKDAHVMRRYIYDRNQSHCGIGEYVAF